MSAYKHFNIRLLLCTILQQYVMLRQYILT